MGNVTCTNSNSTLSYAYKGGGNVARLRCSTVGYTYSQLAEESHARTHRAFYPHRRSQGMFVIIVDLKNYREFNDAMNWFRDYATAALDLDSNPTSPPMSVQVPSRNFSRLGIPVQGMQFGDYVGSMVFSPTIQFISVSDPSDISTAILSASQVSVTNEPKADPANIYFYPDSLASYPGKLQSYLYDQNEALAIAAQEISDELTNESRIRAQLNRSPN